MQDFLFDVILLVLSSLHIVYGLFSVSMWVMLAMLVAMTCMRQDLIIPVEGCIKYWWLFSFWMLFGVLYTNDVKYAVGYVLKIVVLVFALSYCVKQDNTRRIFFLLKIIVLVWISTIVLDLFFPARIRALRLAVSTSSEARLQIIDRAIEELGTKYGIFSDPAVGAFFCACGVGLGIVCLVENQKVRGWAWIAFSVFAIVLTNKRGPMLSVAIASGAIYLVRSSNSARKKLRRVVVVLLVLTVAAYLFLNNQTFVNWLAQVNSNQYSTDHRMTLYRSLFSNFLRHPLLGSGTKSTIKLMNGTDGHNIYLAALSENGVLGLVLLLLAFGASLKHTLDIMNELDQNCLVKASSVVSFCLFTQLYIICYGMTGNPMTTIYSLAMYFMCLGIPVRLQRLLRSGYYSNNE